jgi:Sulfotransferase domain
MTMPPVSPKVFGIGLSRTGTQSLAAALAALGFRTAHWAETEKMVNIGADNTIELDYAGFAAYDALLDIPMAFAFEEIDRTFPGSRFILTVRDTTEWLKSMRRHIATMNRKGTWSPVSRGLHLDLYDTVAYDRELLALAYQRYVSRVLAYFDGRVDLLVVDICRGAGWSTLCRFLEQPVPAAPFPHLS